MRTNIASGPILQTDYGYTGQRNLDDDIGLMDYRVASRRDKARFYSPVLNRFIQPDTIVPNPTNPQTWNRFSYANNNPVKFNDPSGHCSGNATDSQNPDADCWAKVNEIESLYPFVDIDPGNWTEDELGAVQTSLTAMENSFEGVANFENQIGDVTLHRSSGISLVDIACKVIVCIEGWTIGSHIYLFDAGTGGETQTMFTTLHEFGHVFASNGANKYDKFAEEFWECKFLVGGKCLNGNSIGETVSEYASTQPGEDFAETFAMTIWSENFDIVENSIMSSPGQKYPPGRQKMPSPGRIHYMKNLIRPQ